MSKDVSLAEAIVRVKSMVRRLEFMADAVERRNPEVVARNVQSARAKVATAFEDAHDSRKVALALLCARRDARYVYATSESLHLARSVYADALQWYLKQVSAQRRRRELAARDTYALDMIQAIGAVSWEDVADSDRHIAILAVQRVENADGTMLEPSGIDLTRYRYTPTILSEHDPEPENRIGRVTSIYVDDDFPGGPALMALGRLLPAGRNAAADHAWDDIERGVARASIGGLAFEWVEGTPVHLTKTELYEISVSRSANCPAARIIALPRHLRR